MLSAMLLRKYWWVSLHLLTDRIANPKTNKSLPLSPDVKRISPSGIAALAKDVHYLSNFVDTLNNPILQENLDELRQTVALMQADNSDEYYDVSTRNKKYGRVDALTGPLLLEKCFPSKCEKTLNNKS